MDPAATAKQIAEQVQKAQYLSGAALVTYVYDYFLTFDREVTYIWRSRWSSIKIFFVLNRYFIIPNIIVQQFLLGTVTGRRTTAECQGLVQAFIFLTTIITFISETMLCIRLWVLWNKDKRVLVGLMSIFVAISIYYIVDAEKAFSLSKVQNLPFAQPPKGCGLGVQEQHAYVTSIILLSSDVLKVVLALVPTLQIYMSGYILQNNVVNEVYREGVLYYAYLCIYTIIQLVLVVKSADNAISTVPVFIAIRVILASRMVLHIRQLYTHEIYSAQITGSTSRTTYI